MPAKKKQTSSLPAKAPVNKVAAKKAPTKSPAKMKRKGFPWGAVLLSLVVVALLVVVIVLVQRATGGEKPVATVNGEPIYAADIQDQISRLPAEMQALYTEDVILDELIKEKLILQEAERMGITVTDEDVDARMEEIANSFYITVDQLDDLLAAQNLTMEDFREFVREEVLLNKFIDEAVLSKVSVTDTEVETYYNDNIDVYTADEGQVRVRHVLVEDEDTAWDLLDQALDGADFALLAETNSLDTGSASQGGDLGFIDKNTGLVPEFLDAALELRIGEISDPVETQFGWHIIKREPDVIPIRDVSETIRDTLTQEKGRGVFLELLDKLRADADIVYYNETT